MNFFIVADDMTGANVSNSLLAKDGFKVGTLNSLEKVKDYLDFDALGVHTESRGVEPEEAYRRVYDYTKELSKYEFRFMNKRIDSTLRGNLGPEIDAMLDALGEDYVAIVVSSFPDSQKIVISDYMLIDNVLLEKTDVALDPTSPVTESKVSDVLSKNSKRTVETISLKTISEGPDFIEKEIKRLYEDGKRVISLDAVSDQNIDDISKAVLNSGLPFISVDPGPFTHSLAVNLEEGDKKSREKILYVIGSASPIMIDQIQRLREEKDIYVVKMDAERLVDKESKDGEVKRVVNEVVDNLDESQEFLLATILNKDDKLDLSQVSEETGRSILEVSDDLVYGVTEIAENIIENVKDEIGCVYCSGGDVLKAFLDSMNTMGIQIKDEIEPLTVYGKIMGGELDGKAIVTKGGLVGNKDTLVHVSTYIQTKLSSNFSD